MSIKRSIGLSSLLLTSVMVHANVSGTVFQDLPESGTSLDYGTQGTNDLGIAGVTVTAYPGGASTTTTANGSWSLATTGKVRIEFSGIPSHLKESPGQSSVQFLSDNETANLALHNPAEYVGDAQNIAMTLQSNSQLSSNTAALKILSPDNRVANKDNPTTVGDIAINQIGSVWGLAYDNSKKVLYTSAVIRRYSALGTLGTGGIYKIDLANPDSPTVTSFTTVTGTGTVTDNASRDLANNPDDSSHDPLFNEVGNNGLGDIDISEDGTKLYTINLKTNTFIEIDIANPATSNHKTFTINNPFSNCANADVKSWGIGQKDGEVYVGSVCSTNVTQGAYVSKFNGTSFDPVHNIPLNMKGENSRPSNISASKELPNNARWRTWITNPNDLFDTVTKRVSYPAPILSDIIFDENNGMILGFSDRTAMQAGIKNFAPDNTDDLAYSYDASGDVYRVCNVAGTYYNEGATQCPQHDKNIAIPSFPEFFIGEEWFTPTHKEISLGGLAYQQGSKNILSTAFDPAPDGNEYDSAGLIWMNTENGERTDEQKMVGGPTDRKRYNGKAGGMGDIEYLSTPAPTEIGNRVWADNNGNCIQDADEAGIDGVTVNLYTSTDCTGTVEQTTTTANDGHYLFSDITTGIDHSICISDVKAESALNKKELTCVSNGEGTNNSLNNNDASTQGNTAKIVVASALNTAGANNHSFDFGFKPVNVVVTPPVERNDTVNHDDGTCNCHSYETSSVATLNPMSIMFLVFLTSISALLFRKELSN